MKDKKTFSILGDSISTFEGFIPKEFDCFYPREGYDVDSVEKTWWKLLEKNTPLKLSVNGSYSGSRISKTGFERPFWSAFISKERQSILDGDIIIVFGGTNDFGQDKDQADFDTFKQSYNLLVSQMVENFPRSDIYFCTPLQRIDYGLDELNSQGWTQKDMAQAIKDCLRGKNERVKLIDLFSYNISKDDGIVEDGLHPTSKGMKIIYSIIKEAIYI